MRWLHDKSRLGRRIVVGAGVGRMKIDLIEQLGGYDKAKEVLEIVKARDNKYSQYLERPALEKSLLQYRRKHNIFEVGDKVVFKAHFKGDWQSGFGEITHIDNDLEGVTISNNVLVAISEIEHATTEEIQVGCRRLDQIKCWSCDKIFTTKQLSENDGFCIHCNAEVCGG